MCTTCIYGSFGEVGILIICLLFYGCVFTMAFFSYRCLSGSVDPNATLFASLVTAYALSRHNG
jgi:hypothetical protein